MTVTISLTWQTGVVFAAISWATYVILRVGQFYLDHPLAQRILWGVKP